LSILLTNKYCPNYGSSPNKTYFTFRHCPKLPEYSILRDNNILGTFMLSILCSPELCNILLSTSG
jgi:hypothetical protein